MRPTDCDRPMLTRKSRLSLRVAGIALLLGIVSLTTGAQQPRITLCDAASGAGCDEADLLLQTPAGQLPETEFGFAVAMGHLNGDLFSDLVVGAPGEGKVYILYGSLASRAGDDFDESLRE